MRSFLLCAGGHVTNGSFIESLSEWLNCVPRPGGAGGVASAEVITLRAQSPVSSHEGF